MVGSDRFCSLVIRWLGSVFWLVYTHTHTHTHAFEPHTVRRSRSQWIKLIASYSYLLLRPLTHWIREILRGQRHSPYQDALLNCILRDIFRFRSVLRWSLWSYGVLRHICVLTEIQTQTWLKREKSEQFFLVILLLCSLFLRFIWPKHSRRLSGQMGVHVYLPLPAKNLPIWGESSVWVGDILVMLIHVLL